MSKTKFLNYMASEKGRRRVVQGIGFVGIAIFSAQYLPHTYFVSQLQKFMQSYQNGIERTVSDTIKKRFDEAMEKCDCSTFEKKFLKPFVVVGFDVHQIGTPKSRFSGLVGVPTNYSYNSVQDVDRANIQLGHESIDWSSEDGKRLQEALVLAEDEQIFGIARSILLLKTHHLLLKSAYAPVTILLVYTLGTQINKKRQLFSRPLSLRLCLYTLLGIFGVGLYVFAIDFTQNYYDTYVDQTLASFGQGFVRAGVGFYDKQLQKNISLRNMLKTSDYTSCGNVNYFLRQRSVPLTTRKKFFEKQLEQLNDPSECKAENLTN